MTHAQWAAAATVPVSVVAGEQQAAVIWGQMLPPGRNDELTASELCQWWAGGQAPDLPACDGYHIAACWNTAGAVAIGADPLGHAPVYWWSKDGVLLVGSSPELFRHHPTFSVRPSLTGMAGLLMTNGLVGGQTILEGVRRLAPGHLLLRGQDGSVREQSQYRIPLGSRDAQRTLPELVEQMDTVLESAVRRHCGSRTRRVLLLSGGRDSRLIAGYLRRINADFTSITRGARSDFDLRCAQGVARHLGIPHVCIPHDQGGYAAGAVEKVRWTHLAHGFRSAGSVRDRQILQALGTRAVTGYATGSLVGGIHVQTAIPGASDPTGFSGYLTYLSRRVLPPQVAAALLGGASGREAVDAATRAARETFEEYGGAPAQAIWAFELHHEQRYHVGSAPWRLALDVWPEQPCSDRTVINLVAGMPIGLVADRQIQLGVLRDRFPDLAALPFEHGEQWPLPLQPRMAAQAWAGVYQRWRRLRARLPGQARQRSYYLRLFDFNGPGWREVRRLAEPARARAHQLFDRTTLDQILPGPDVPVNFSRHPVRPAGLQLLVGFLLWCDLNL